MKNIIALIGVFALLSLIVSSCQEDFIVDIEDRPTDLIEFSGITASKDSACMFDTIVLTANARGENLRFTWQYAKGSLVAIKGEPDKVYFWGCQTCCGDLTVSCTVENEHGAYTRDVTVFIYPWRRDQPAWSQERFEKWLEQIKDKQ